MNEKPSQPSTLASLAKSQQHKSKLAKELVCRTLSA